MKTTLDAKQQGSISALGYIGQVSFYQQRITDYWRYTWLSSKQCYKPSSCDNCAVLFSVISSFDVYPLNKAVLAGHRMELKCKASQSETVNRWTVARVGQRVEVIFQNSGNPNTTYVDARFGQDGDNILYLNRTELKDAGAYTCFKNQDAVQSSAHLIVLGKHVLFKNTPML